MLGMSFKKLKIWQKAMELSMAVYDWTKKFPREEIYGLVSQMRRAAISIASNIAEGAQRGSNKEFANFILMSRGSLAELETQTMIAMEKVTQPQDESGKQILSRCEEVSRMIHTFHSKLKTQDS